MLCTYNIYMLQMLQYVTICYTTIFLSQCYNMLRYITMCYTTLHSTRLYIAQIALCCTLQPPLGEEKEEVRLVGGLMFIHPLLLSLFSPSPSPPPLSPSLPSSDIPCISFHALHHCTSLQCIALCGQQCTTFVCCIAQKCFGF